MSLKLEVIGGDLSLLPFITLIMVYNGHREISLFSPVFCPKKTSPSNFQDVHNQSITNIRKMAGGSRSRSHDGHAGHTLHTDHSDKIRCFYYVNFAVFALLNFNGKIENE